MKQLIWFTVLFIIITGFNAQAQNRGDLIDFNPRFEHFTLPGGIAANGVQGIVQDSTGFLWFATQAGLIRYDGQNFQTYRYDPNIANTPASDYIEYIYLDSKGLIWMTHWQQGGLTCFDPEREIFTRYKNDPDDPETISDDNLSVVVEDRSGYIWVGGQGGLDRLDPETGKFRHFHHDPGNPQSLSCDQVRALYVDRQGTLWVGTGFPWDGFGLDTGGLNRYDPTNETFTRYMYDPGDPNSISNNKVRAILEDSQGNFWIGTAGEGLQRMDRTTGTFERFAYDPAKPGKLSRPVLRGSDPSTLPSYSHVTCIFEDRENRLWITAIDGGLNVYDPLTGVIRHFERGPGKDDLNSNFLWQVSQTRDGTLWITSGGEGRTVFKVSERQELIPFYETKHRPEDSLCLVHGITKDRSGNIWIAQENPSRLKRIDPLSGNEEIFTLGDQKNPVNYIVSLSIDNKGKLWAGTNLGLFRGDPSTGDFQLMRPSKISPEIYSTFLASPLQARDGRYWFASFEYGLFQIDPETGNFVNYRHDPGDPGSLGGNRLWGLYEDAAGNLWVGGGSPYREQDKPLFVDRLNQKTGTFEHFVKGERILGFASDLIEDPKGNIWFTKGDDGLYMVNPQNREFKKITSYNSLLPPGQILSMLKSKDGKIWINMDENLIEFDPETETMTVFNAYHGVRVANDYWGSAGITDDGELLFARKKGFHAFFPRQLLLNYTDNSSDLRITGFRLLDEPIVSGPANSIQGILKEPIWQTRSIRLDFDQNVFSFSLACFDFCNPGASQLQFILEGYDRGWRRDLREGETPSYINIPPGDYTFRVRGSSSYGAGNRDGISLGITILPPWWRTWWAYTIYGLLFLAMVIIADRFQRRRLLERQRQLNREKELGHAREIEKAYNRLKTTQSQLVHAEKMASLGELTAGIAHEIQNPLNFVNNFSEVSVDLITEMYDEIKNGNTDEVQAIADDLKQNLEKIHHHGKRASGIVKGMLEHSRSSAGEKVLTDINALAEEYLRLAYHGLRAKDKSFNADFKMEPDETLPRVKIIPQDIGRVLLNLINNAFYTVSVKKTGALNIAPQQEYKPLVTVSTRNLGSQVEIRVKDNGDGIPQNILDKIFQPFFTTKPSGQGTGLGLSLSYDIITKGHGGELKVDTEVGEGTEFIIVLPDTEQK